MEGIQIGKEEVKLSLFADDMIPYIDNPKDSTKKLLELINEFSKVAGTKLISRNQLHIKGKLIKQSHSWLLQKEIKYLGINSIKNVKDLYSQNYKRLKKGIEEDSDQWKHILCSWIRRINIIKMSLLPKAPVNSIQCLLKYQWHISQI